MSREINMICAEWTEDVEDLAQAWDQHSDSPHENCWLFGIPLRITPQCRLIVWGGEPRLGVFWNQMNLDGKDTVSGQQSRGTA